MTKAKSPKYRVKFRRRREGKTNYTKRLALIKSGETRAVIRKSNKAINIQFVNFAEKGDRTVLTFNSLSLKKLFGWDANRNKYSAYLAGLQAGKMAKQKGIKKFVVDIGMQIPSKGTVVFAALKGIIDAGLETNFGEGILPELNNPPQNFEETKKTILNR